jgi:uncharacterized protein YegP (UPF0339 family)
MKAVIKQVSHGKLKHQFRFILYGQNNEIIATSETYTQKHNVTELLDKYFPNFKQVDKTKNKQNASTETASIPLSQGPGATGEHQENTSGSNSGGEGIDSGEDLRPEGTPGS